MERIAREISACDNTQRFFAALVRTVREGRQKVLLSSSSEAKDPSPDVSSSSEAKDLVGHLLIDELTAEPS